MSKKFDVQKLIGRIRACIDRAPTFNEAERAIVRAHVEAAAYEAAERIANPRIDEMKPPVPRLTKRQVAAIKKQGNLHPWSKRGDDRRWPVDWVRDFYGAWIPGLLQKHILHADPPLYGAFMQHKKRKGLPADLDVPTAAENRLREMPNPAKRRALLMSRRLHAAQVRYLEATRQKK